MAEIRFTAQQKRGLFFRRSKFNLQLSIRESQEKFTYAHFYQTTKIACQTLAMIDEQLNPLLHLPSRENLELRSLRGRPSNITTKGSRIEELLLLRGEIFDIPPSLQWEFVPIEQLTSHEFSYLIRSEFARFEGRSEIVHRLSGSSSGLESGLINTLNEVLEIIPCRFSQLQLGVERFRGHLFGSMAGFAPAVCESHLFKLTPGQLDVSLEVDFFRNLSDITFWLWIKHSLRMAGTLHQAVEEVERRVATVRLPEFEWEGTV